MLNVIQPGWSRSTMLATCFGGITVASKTWMRLLAPSASHSSRSSGVSATPWLGQPWRFVGPFSNPATSTRCSIFPVVRSPTSKPSRSLTFTKQSVCAPFIVNGRIDVAERPDRARRPCACRDRRSTSSGDFSPARYTCRPSGPKHGVVRARAGHDARDRVAGARVEHVPVRPFERRHVQHAAVRREGQPIAAAVVRAVPQHRVGRQIEREHALDACSRTAGRSRALAAMPFTFSGSSPAGSVHRRDPAHEAVAVVHVEDEHADAAVLDVVADAGLGHVEEPVLGCLGAAAIDAVWTCSGRPAPERRREAERGGWRMSGRCSTRTWLAAGG